MLGRSALSFFSLACALVLALFLMPEGLGRTAAGSDGVEADTASKMAAIEGTVLLPPRRSDRRRFRGRAYRQRTNQATRSPERERASTSENRYRSVVVSAHPLSADTTVQPMPDTAEIDQRDASFVPQVTVVTAGSTVEFINSDPFYHNVFSLTPGARFNIGRRPTGVVVPRTIPSLDEPAPGVGVVELHCDIHPQMNAFIVSLETPYFGRANADGTYRLDDLPPGRYRIHAFMPRQDLVSFTVDLREGQHASRTIDLR